jgi:hypothetical protein
MERSRRERERGEGRGERERGRGERRDRERESLRISTTMKNFPSKKMDKVCSKNN